MSPGTGLTSISFFRSLTRVSRSLDCQLFCSSSCLAPRASRLTSLTDFLLLASLPFLRHTDPSVSIRELDIPVNAVATALKDFFSKRLPALIPVEEMNELTSIAGIQDRSERLLALRDLIQRLPPANFLILKFVFEHFVR